MVVISQGIQVIKFIQIKHNAILSIKPQKIEGRILVDVEGHTSFKKSAMIGITGNST